MAGGRNAAPAKHGGEKRTPGGGGGSPPGGLVFLTILCAARVVRDAPPWIRYRLARRRRASMPPASRPSTPNVVGSGTTEPRLAAASPAADAEAGMTTLKLLARYVKSVRST